MNPEQPMDARTDLEVRVVALLLGEASPFEEAQLLRLIEQDAELAAFYREMQKTVGLLREVSKPCATGEPPVTLVSSHSASPPKLSPTRRAALLAQLQTAPASCESDVPPAGRCSASSTPRRRLSWLRNMEAPLPQNVTLVLKLAAVLALLAILSSLLLPALSTVKARSSTVAAAHQKQREALELRLKQAEGWEQSVAPVAMTGMRGDNNENGRRLEDSPAQTTPLKASSPVVLGAGVREVPASGSYAGNIYLPATDAASDAGKLDSRNDIAAAGVNQAQALFFHAEAGDYGGGGGGRAGGAMQGGQAPVQLGAVDQPESLRKQTKTEAAHGNAPTALGAPVAGRFTGPSAPPPSAPQTRSRVPVATLSNGQTPADAMVSTAAGSTGVDTYFRIPQETGGVGAAVPSQRWAFEDDARLKVETDRKDAFGFIPPNVNIVINARLPEEQSQRKSLEVEERFKEVFRLGRSTMNQDSRERLGELEARRELERLARQSADMATADTSLVRRNRALAEEAPAESLPGRDLSVVAGKPVEAEAKKIPALDDKLDWAADGQPRGTPMTPPARGPAPRPAASEPEDKRKADTTLPPLIHQMEVQTAPASALNFSTFSLNVSDVSFKTAAASLQAGQMPDPHSIRVEEFLNALNYRDPAPPPGTRIAFHWEMARHPFAHQRDLLRFSLQTAAHGRQAAQPLNLVVLLDNSGSMGRPDRVAIVAQALRVLAGKLQPRDKWSVVAFARRAQLCVDGQTGDRAPEGLQTVLRLNPEGGTDLGAGLDLAYRTALKHYHPQANNRVLLLTDGAANLGDVDPDVLRQKVATHRQKGVALDCFGVGWEGLDDDLLELLARHGDGRYALLNDVEQAAGEFAEKLAGALNVAAADVKTQVEFNPHRVTAYRQIGYARHQLTREQFRDNTVDAAELAAAEAGNAMYVVQVNPQGHGPLGFVRVRYRVPATGEFEEREWILPYVPQPPPLSQASPAMRLAATAALLGEYLARNPYAGEIQLRALHPLAASAALAFEPDPRPRQLVDMLQQVMRLEGRQ